MEYKYSVLMSLYIKENPFFFMDSIDSMLKQSIKPDQIVIVKDGPLTLELENVLNEFVEREPELFTIVSLEKNLGLGLALNEGIKKCRNELIARMDTDDISLSNRCELQLMEFNNDKNLSIVGTLTNEFYDTPKNVITSRIVPEKHDDILRFSKRRSPFNHPTVMYKKTALLKVNGYQDVKRKEDLDLFLRMLNEGMLGFNIQKPLLLFRSNKDNYKRRKTWLNCKSYIDVMYFFWKKKYLGNWDLIYVIAGQLIMYLSPNWLLRIISDSLLRKKAVKY